MPNKLTVGIVIINWNRLDLTKSCLKYLASQTYQDKLVVVIDNGSIDGSKKWLADKDNIIYISNRRNQGFARALNTGIDKALENNCSYVMALNNDVELDNKWLEKMVEYMEQHQDIDFAQGASMQASNHNTFDSTGIYLERGFIPRQRAEGKTTPELETPSIGPNAAGSIYRSTLLQKVAYRKEYFDKRFFAYVEDIDFDLKCVMRGYKFGYLPSAKLYHLGSASGQSVANKKMYWGARNMIWLVYKNVPFYVFRKTFKSIVKSHLANLEYLWKQQRKNFGAYLRGLLVGLLLCPLFIAKRSTNLKNKKISDKDLLDLLVPSNPPLSNPFRAVRGLLK